MTELILTLTSLLVFLVWLIWFLIKRNKENRLFMMRMRALTENLSTVDLLKSGYAGTLSNGNIVDRRIHPDAMPIPENEYLGIIKPKKV